MSADIDKELAAFEADRLRIATEIMTMNMLAEEGEELALFRLWKARATPSLAPTDETEFVTVKSALAALDYLDRSNADGRKHEAQDMLVAAPIQQAQQDSCISPLRPAPAAATELPEQIIFDLAAAHELTPRGLWGQIRFGTHGIVEYTRAIELELDSRSRVQGGNTKRCDCMGQCPECRGNSLAPTVKASQ